MAVEDNAEELPAPPARSVAAHKGDFGHALIVACSRGLTGAGLLASRAAGRGGAGLVTLAGPEELIRALLPALSSTMSLGLPSRGGMLTEAAARPLLAAVAARRGTAIGVGPGLGRGRGVERFLAGLLSRVEGSTPLVLDADALFHLGARPSLLAGCAAPRVITPHVGEAARLLGWEASRVAVDRPAAARALAERCGGVAVLKGAGTLIDDGARCWRNGTGNPGMATGGSGDVLTGLIAALLAQGLAPVAAARLAVYVHGRAGDLAAAEVGAISLLPDDLVDRLGVAFGELIEESDRC